MAIRKRKEPKMANDEKPKNGGFIGRVVEDPANPPQTRLLTGWLGDAADEGYQRLYTDAELSSYTDIPDEAILYTEPMRDVQPAGCVFVWIRRDAAVKQGGSAASRAGRFLQGQVAQDFSSPEKAGFRCVTQTPCAEPTGFTGQCTKQPDVGGAWPCITAVPMCSVPTGFTGQCTHQPWPNPSEYIGCTFLHCPTNDLTHQPRVCHIVATGMPGCGGGFSPPEGGGEQPAAAEGADAAEGGSEAAAPLTRLPGCGYTKSWGLCETKLLGCGFTKTWGWCQPTLQPNCQVSVDNPCITQTEMPPRCGGGGLDLAAENNQPAGDIQPSVICATNIGCNFTLFGCGPTHPAICGFRPTVLQPQCFRTRLEPQCLVTRIGPGCFVVPSPFCPPRTPVTPGCPAGGINPRVQFDEAAGNVAVTGSIGCDPSAVDACPTRINCDTQPPTAFCTPLPQHCPTACGRDCQTPQPGCTSLNCTHAGPQCPDPTVGIACTVLQPQCPRDTNVQLDCTFGCTQFGTNCNTSPQQCAIHVTQDPACAVIRGQEPTPATVCFICTQAPHLCGQPAELNAFAAARAGGAIPGGLGTLTITAPITQFDCVPITIQTIRCTGFSPQCGGPLTINRGAVFQGATNATVCTQFGQQCRSAVDACPTRLCGGMMNFAEAPNTAATTCTQFGPQCGGGGGGQTAATTCTQFGQQCRSAVDACPTRLCGGVMNFAEAPNTAATTCTQFGPQCGGGGGQTAATTCTQFGQQCRSAVDACPTRLCGGMMGFAEAQNTAATTCTQFGPQCGGGGGQTAATTCTQFGQQCRSAVDACPTRLCGQEAFQAPGTWPTPMTRCFIC